jgi:hypothetical protein
MRRTLFKFAAVASLVLALMIAGFIGTAGRQSSA